MPVKLLAWKTFAANVVLSLSIF